MPSARSTRCSHKLSQGVDVTIEVSEGAYELALTQDFQRALLKLDTRQQEAVQQALLNVQRGFESAHVHKLSHGLCSFGVNRDALRVICAREGSLLILLHVNAHDPAYAWADRHRVAQVGRYVRILRSQIEDAAELAREATDAPRPAGPLHGATPKQLRYFDVSPHAAHYLQRVPDDDTLMELLEHFRTPVGEALMGMATAPETFEQLVLKYQDALREAAQQPQPAPVPLAEALADAQANGAQFWLPPDAAQLARALRGDFEAWRVFLHPSQRRLVTRRAKGACKVTGGPGTGKSIVAMHRARFLIDEVCCDDPRPVLLTTYTKALTRALSQGWQTLMQDASERAARVEVHTLTQVAMRLLAQAGKPNQLVTDQALRACWDEAMAHETQGRPRGFYEAEREHVMARHDAWTREAYERAPRMGRRTRLDRGARRQVFAVLDAFEQALAARGGGDDAALAREAARALAAGEVSSPYAAVVCDELQDVSAPALRMLAALASDDEGSIGDDRLFLVGDVYQSLYRSPVSLLQCGIEVRGNAHVLKRNYRTTEGIRREAVRVIAGVGLGDEQDSASLEGYVSERSGPGPLYERFDDADAEARWIAQVSQEGEGALLVLARTRAWLEGVRARLGALGARCVVLQGTDAPSPEAGVVTLCTLHRAKGLEAPRVIIAGAQLIPQGWPGDGDEGDREVWAQRERCLMYVGMTRARDWCGVSRVASH